MLENDKKELVDQQLETVNGGDGDSYSKPIQINIEKCDSCGKCAANCPRDNVIQMINGVYSIDLSSCVHCGVCLDYCSSKAIEINWDLF